MAFGPEFVNVTDAARLGALALVGDGVTNNRLPLAALVAAFPVGIYYFPPGRYRFDEIATVLSPPTYASGVFNQTSAAFPPAITLWFAPGAMLVPAGSSNIEIGGQIRAGLHQIFAAFQQGDAPNGGNILFAFTSGPPAVIQPGRVRRVFPEWWGARGQVARLDDPSTDFPARDDAVAIQAAIDAAYNHRVYNRPPGPTPAGPTWPAATTTGNVRLPPLEVVLSGQYRIGRALTVGQSAFNVSSLVLPNPDGFVMRAPGGNRAPTSDSFGNPLATYPTPATITCRTAFASTAMLSIVDAGGVHLENVSFDGNGVVQECVRLDFGTGAGSAPLGSLPVHPLGLFRGCAFRDAQQTLVRVGMGLSALLEQAPAPGSNMLTRDEEIELALSGAPGPPSPRAPDPTLTRGDFDPHGLSFEGCQFFQPAFKPPAGAPAQSRFGVVLRASKAVGVNFVGCQFTGHSDAMIAAWGGVFWVANCLFVNRTPPHRFVTTLTLHGGIASAGPVMTALTAKESPGLFSGTPRGVDIWLALPLPELVNGVATFRSMASFSAVNCVSRSGQFLGSFPGRYVRSGDGAVRRVGPDIFGSQETTRFEPIATRRSVMINVQHRTEGRGPSVFWGGAGRLVIVACDLRGVVGSRLAEVDLVAPGFTGGLRLDPAKVTTTYSDLERVSPQSARLEQDTSLREEDLRRPGV